MRVEPDRPRGSPQRVYGCSHHHKRGVCGNGLTQSVARVDSAFLGALEREVLTPERFAHAVRCGVDRVREQLTKDPTGALPGAGEGGPGPQDR